MLLVAKRSQALNLDAKRVTAWAGVLLLHILVVGMVLLPKAPLAPPAKLFDPYVPVELSPPQEPPPLPVPPIVVPPAPAQLRYAPPPLATPSTPAAPQASEPAIVVSTPTEAPMLAPAAVSLPGAEVNGTGNASLLSLKKIHAPPPAYPRRELARGISGTVELRVLVGVDGLPQRIEIMGGSGVRAFEFAAMRAVKRWRFQPHRVDGVPRAAWALVPVNFRIED